MARQDPFHRVWLISPKSFFQSCCPRLDPQFFYTVICITLIFSRRATDGLRSIQKVSQVSRHLKPEPFWKTPDPNVI